MNFVEKQGVVLDNISNLLCWKDILVSCHAGVKNTIKSSAESICKWDVDSFDELDRTVLVNV